MHARGHAGVPKKTWKGLKLSSLANLQALSKQEEKTQAQP